MRLSYLKSKLKDPIQLTKEKNQIIDFHEILPFTLHTILIAQKLACNTSYHTNMVDDPFSFFSIFL